MLVEVNHICIISFPPSLLPSPGSPTIGADLHKRALIDLGLYSTHDWHFLQGRDEPQGRAKGREGTMEEWEGERHAVLLFVESTHTNDVYPP